MRARTSKLLRVGEAARLIGVHRDTVQRWCRTGALACVVTAGGHFRIDARALDKFVPKQQKKHK